MDGGRSVGEVDFGWILDLGGDVADEWAVSNFLRLVGQVGLTYLSGGW